jgi:hypothetical protein
LTTQPQPDTRNTHPNGRFRIFIQAAWLALVVLGLLTFAAGVPVRFNHLQDPVSEADRAIVPGIPPELEAAWTLRLDPREAAALASSGLSLRFYAAYTLLFDVILVLVCAAVGVFIFWRRSDDWLALWISLLVILLGTNAISAVVPSLASVWPGTVWVTSIAGFFGMVSNVHILFLSPDGRFVPHWTLYLAAAFTGGMLALGLYAAVVAGRWGFVRTLALLLPAFPIWFSLLGLGFISQVYRYRRVSGPVQRQQTKWLAAGLTGVTLGFAANSFFLFAASQYSGLPGLLYNLARAPVVNLCMVSLPVCLGFSILRYRLWDIDLIIRRTLIYSSLTAALALVYLSSVVLLQSLFGTLTGEHQSELVTVISTLAIAALFVPLRRRVQAGIDRLFYRRKYDAERVLAAFSVTLRDEVDLDRLSNSILGVVDETVQPAHVSLWLPDTGLKKSTVLPPLEQ